LSQYFPHFSSFFFSFFFTNVILYYSHVIVCLWNTWIYLNTVCNVLCQITCMPFIYLIVCEVPFSQMNSGL
jgi:hypothetical protein